MTEYQHQRTVMEWSCYASNRIRYPGLDLLYHIPNEIKCNAAQGKQRKDIGVKSGVPDLCLPVARGQYHGYLTKVCYGFDEAIRCIKEYYSYGE